MGRKQRRTAVREVGRDGKRQMRLSPFHSPATMCVMCITYTHLMDISLHGNRRVLTASGVFHPFLPLLPLSFLLSSLFFFFYSLKSIMRVAHRCQFSCLVSRKGSGNQQTELAPFHSHATMCVTCIAYTHL